MWVASYKATWEIPVQVIGRYVHDGDDDGVEKQKNASLQAQCEKAIQMVLSESQHSSAVAGAECARSRGGRDAREVRPVVKRS